MCSTTPLTANRDTLSQIAPKLAQLSEEVLFGDIWQRGELSPRDRSLITLSALVAQSRSEQLPYHLRLARKNGVTDSEIVELCTHLAFYSGWPTAASALTVYANLPDEQAE